MCLTLYTDTVSVLVQSSLRLIRPNSYSIGIYHAKSEIVFGLFQTKHWYYIATNKTMPTIPYDENNRSFNTEDIVDSEKSIKDILTLPNVKLLGSDQGCGCGFRHAMFEDNRWLDVIDDDETPFDNSNHVKLVDFITKNNKGEKSVELFALWAGDIYPAEYRETIKLNYILDPVFYFKERGLYTVEI